MKKLLPLFLIAAFLFTGCSFSGERFKEPVKFYYPRLEYQYRSQDGVIAWEEREASGHRDNLSYLLALYRLGPSSEELSLPFPEGTAILMMEQTDDEIRLALGSSAVSMSDADFSIACACLTLTCIEIANVRQVTVINGQKSLTMTRDSIVLFDTTMTEATEVTA